MIYARLDYICNTQLIIQRPHRSQDFFKINRLDTKQPCPLLFGIASPAVVAAVAGALDVAPHRSALLFAANGPRGSFFFGVGRTKP